MKQTRSLVLGWVLALSLLALPGCSRPRVVASFETPLDVLARRVPGDAEEAFFLDLEPDGEAGRHWERIRQQLEAHPTGQEGLHGLLGEFRLDEYGLDESFVRPTVTGSWDGTGYIIVQVGDENEGAVRDALYQYLWNDTTWEQEECEGQTLYHGRNEHSWRRYEWVAWAVYDGNLLLSHIYNYNRPTAQSPSILEQPLAQLRALVSLAPEDSLAASSAWQTLRGRLPEAPMGLLFSNLAESRSSAAAPDSLAEAFSRQLEAIALAAVPERNGMRVEIVAQVALQDAPPEFRALFDLPAMDPATWTSLPSNTAVTWMAHDASVLWPWLKELFLTPGSASGSPDRLAQIRDVVGLDLETDLASAEGPLTGDFAVAITPPLLHQPIVQDVPAGQLLVLGRDVSQAQMADVQAAMESRGAVFGLREVEGVALQTQAGTELSGYAISYGFDGDTLLFGSSPDIIGQAVTARREAKGLVTIETFQSFLQVLPAAPSLVIYCNGEPMTRLAQANMTEDQYQHQHLEYHLFEVFEAVGIGLRLAPDGIDGVAYFFLPD
jgi:hypothetical protein